MHTVCRSTHVIIRFSMFFARVGFGVGTLLGNNAHGPTYGAPLV